MGGNGEPIDSEIAQEFRKYWRGHPNPTVPDFLRNRKSSESKDDLRLRPLQVELTLIDLELRARAGQLVAHKSAIDTYHQWYPAISAEQIMHIVKKEREWLVSAQTALLKQDNLPELPEGPQLAIPEITGYANLSRVGQGTYGAVYKAVQLGTNRLVAIKCIRPELDVDDKLRQLFIREASITTKLKHPRIVEAITFGFHELRPYLVMEHIAAEDLEDIIWRHEPARRVRVAVKVVLAVLDALSHAHEAGVVHRDIKPANILASTTGGRLRVKVSDFGVAKMFETGGHSGITKSGELCGTLAFMSPEQIEDSRRAKPDCDLYATLVCLYRFLTKEYPQPIGPAVQVIGARLNPDIIPAQQFNPQIPDELAAIIQRGLSRKLSDRYPTASSLRDALAALPILQK